ncbi:MAG: hypothetical protein VX246_03915 [Myxococcota bacterium]|nr:hypothetical protein [Myxococcota bacterium]
MSLAGSANAQGKLWLLGDRYLEVDSELTGDDVQAKWVPGIFKEIIGDALPKKKASLNVLIISATDNGPVMAPTLEAIDDELEALKFDEEQIEKSVTVKNAEELQPSPNDRSGDIIEIKNAHLVWLIDGTTEDYVEDLSDLAATVIANHFSDGGVVVGQGRAVSLFGEVFLNEHSGNTLKLPAALSDPTPGSQVPNVTMGDAVFEAGFLTLLPGTVIAPNFLSKGRLGLMPVILAKFASQPLPLDLLAIGVADATALRVDNGVALVFGGGSVTFQHAIDGETVFEIADGKTPHITDLRHHQFTEGYEFDVNNLTVLAVPDSADDLSANPDLTKNAV